MVRITKSMTEAQWHEWRRNGLGSSDAPILMGWHKFKTPYGLWEDKMGLTPPKPPGFIQKRGHEVESKVRAIMELHLNCDFAPAFFENGIHRASLDGFNADKGIMLEIKLLGREPFQALKERGEIPQEYYTQIQHQFMASGLKKGYFCGYCEGETAFTEVSGYPDYMLRLQRVQREFWDTHIIPMKAPELTEKDWKGRRDEKLDALCAQYPILKRQFDDAELQLKRLKTEIEKIALVNHPRVKCNGLRIGRYSRSGAIDYVRLCKEKEIDAEPYRKPPSSYVMIREDKE